MNACNDRIHPLADALVPYLAEGNTYCVGFSGGGDSMALLHVVCSLREQRHFTVAALHMNHCLRAQESDREEEFCREIAASLGSKIAVRKIDVRMYADQNRLSLEDAARRCRFHWFLEECRRLHAACLFLAHHADDQAETVLLRLLRGAGMTGLGGMKPETRFHDLLIVRPWLNIRRCVLDTYREEFSLPCCHDSSNDAVHHDRNWIRHVVIPQLNGRFGPDIAERLIRTAHVNRAAADYMHHAACDFLTRYARDSFAGTVFPVQEFNICHVALQREITRQLLLSGGEDHIQAGFDMVESVRTYLTGSERNCPACLPGTMRISKAFGSAVVASGVTRAIEPISITPGVPTEVIPGITVIADLVQKKGIPCSDNGEGWAEAVTGSQVELVQYASIPAKSIFGIRSRMPGDRYHPVNGNMKKVKDLMINAGIPNDIKEKIPVVTVDGAPAWLAGWRIAEEYKVTPGEPVYRLSCRINWE